MSQTGVFLVAFGMTMADNGSARLFERATGSHRHVPLDGLAGSAVIGRNGTCIAQGSGLDSSDFPGLYKV